MQIENAAIASLIFQLAGELEAKGENKFKIKAYRTAAKNINSFPKSVAKLVMTGSGPEQIPGVGKGIAGVVTEIVKFGKLKQLGEVEPASFDYLKELSEYPRLEPIKVRRIYDKLKINSVRELQSALESGELEKKLGSRTAFQIKEGLNKNPFFLRANVEGLADKLYHFLEKLPPVKGISFAGAYRRKCEIIETLNFVVISKEPESIREQLEKFAGIVSTDIQGGVITGKILNGCSLEIYCSTSQSFGSALIENTGSEPHLKALKEKTNYLKAGAFTTEEKSYNSLKLQFIEPELREGRGEVEASYKNKLPKLVELKDIRGDLHAHTTASDGANSIEEMIERAVALGYEYLSISDHSQSLKIANGLSEERLLRQIDEIERIQEKYSKIKILKSAEVDILEDGSLDYSKKVLKQLDLCVCSIHSKFRLTKEKQTSRILRAIENPYFTILGHATGRLLLSRQPYEIDMERILQAIKEKRRLVEINSSPDRLDLSDTHAKLAKEMGIKLAVNTDAHSVNELDFMRYGINQARRAWLEKKDILNCLSWKELSGYLNKRI